MFEYADSPLVRNGQYHPGEREMLAKMINRLRLISGRNFGYDPALTSQQNEAAIAAWEQWFKAGGQIQFTPDAKLLDVPAEWIVRLGWGRKSNQDIAARYTPGGSTRSPSRGPCSSRLCTLRCQTVRRRAGHLREDGREGRRQPEQAGRGDHLAGAHAGPARQTGGGDCQVSTGRRHGHRESISVMSSTGSSTPPAPMPGRG